MIKKIYKQPSMKVIELESNDILAASDLKLFRNTQAEEYDEEKHGAQDAATKNIWGSQW